MNQAISKRSTGKLLVTGAHGFVGRHVASAIREGVFGDAELHAAPEGLDIRDEVAVDALVEQVRPDSVLHLAAQSFVPRSFDDPRETFDINLVGTLNLLMSLKRSGFKGRMLYVSSGDVYGSVPDNLLPVDESVPAAPRSPYAASKVAAEQLCLQWHRAEGLDVVVARPFNHVGPGQDARFVLPSLARQLVAIAGGHQSPVIEVGDIDTTRDFTDVRDIVAAYAAMLERGIPGATYVIGTGRERRVRDLLDQMSAIAGVAPTIHQDPAKLRPAEQRRMAANASRLRSDTGWEPKIPIETTLRDILDSARNDP